MFNIIRNEAVTTVINSESNSTLYKNTSANTSTAHFLKAPKALIFKAFGENWRGPERI